ncbi:zinc finger protein-domain-containing protein [Penicillium waksmanii]|uniref:zinc finger protein-domain-containing protein n=1 Tax=Penicillium waksmanii TaxID=69791 RepID=UPI002547E85F|nr:zinc finger protein-domain-containing protein [Penicillium waksmanii]KAJ5965783.1 zinc finger protein-domain-containing protein [Penicillium waksmanii]
MDALRRAAQHSSEDSPTSMTSSLRSNINLSNKLSAILDQHHNETVINDLDLNESSSPDTILSRVLTPKSYSSTVSSFALFQQTQQPLPFVEYRVIGFGQCGLVFEKPGQGYVLKVAKHSYEDALWADLRAHLRVQEAFDNPQNSRIECRVPRLYSYVPKGNNVWWERNMNLFPPVHDSITLPAMTLLNRVRLSLQILQIVTVWLACIWVVVVSQQPLPPNFTLRNFNLHLDQMVDLKYPVHSLATAIGEALAIIHWSANVDAYDIEFVLGSEGDRKYGQDVLATLRMSSDDVAAMAPHTDIEALLTVNFMRRTTRLWILDFNLCNSWDETAAVNNSESLVAHPVEAFFENDPYYPLPLMEDVLEQNLWDMFRSSYIAKASQVLHGRDDRLAGLPHKFIDGCIQREKESLEKGLGHGYRELKQ